MGRKKKIAKEKENTSEEAGEKKFDFSISSDVKRNVAGVILFTLAVLVSLGFFGYAGLVGEFSN